MGSSKVCGQTGAAVQVFNEKNAPGGFSPSLPWRIPVSVSVSASAGYDENVNTLSSDTEGSSFSNVGVNLTYPFGTSRTRGSLSTNFGLTYYPDISDIQYDTNANLTLSLTHQVSSRLTLSGSAFATYQQEPNFAVGTDVGVNRRSGNYLNSQNSVSASYSWYSRFSTVTSYSLGIIQYDDDTVGAFQNRFEHGFSQQLRYLFLPVTTIVAEHRLRIVSYDSSFGDSMTHSALAGVDHRLGPRLGASVRVGAEFQSSDARGGVGESNRTSPYFEGNFSYALGGRISLSWNNRYSIEEPNVAESTSSTTFRTGLQASYSIHRRITTTLGAYYIHDSNGGLSTFSEDSLDFSLGAQYAVNRHLSANISYSHTEVSSDIPSRSYSRSRYSVGLNFVF